MCFQLNNITVALQNNFPFCDKLPDISCDESFFESTGRYSWANIVKRENKSVGMTELVSVGMEHLSNGRDAARFVQEDREHMLYTLQAIEN